MLTVMPKKNLPDQPATSFEQAMAELELLVEKMESGALPLEASLDAYKRGAELVKYCAAQLERVEQKVKILEGEMLTPFEDDQDEGEGDEE